MQQLCATLEPGLPARLREMLGNGTIAVGEVGRNVPHAAMVTTEGHTFAIELTSGMMDFLYGVARTLAGLDTSNASLPGPPQTIDVVSRLVGAILRTSARHIRWHWLWPWGRIRWAECPITASAREWAEMIATMSELSVLAHELGHVALATGTADVASENDEVAADRCGLGYLVAAAQQRWHVRITYAAAIVPLRILALMQRLGAQFGDQYPPQQKRMELLREQVAKLCPSESYLYEASTVMVAYQDMLDDVERHILGSLAVQPDGERVMVRLLAELQEVARDRVPVATMVENIGLLARELPRDAIVSGAAKLVAEYAAPTTNVTLLSADTRAKMAVSLGELLRALPPDLRRLFPE